MSNQPEERKAADKFKDAASFTTHTPQDQRERDLAEVIKERVELAGAKDTPEYTAFKRYQSVIGDLIISENDPAKRQELRTEREAHGHLYVAKLSDRVAFAMDAAGQHDAASELRNEAVIRREIAGQLFGPDKGGRNAGEAAQDGPQGPKRPDGGHDHAAATHEATDSQKVETTRRSSLTALLAADKAAMEKAAADAGLGRTAKVVAMVKGPEASPEIEPGDDIRDAARARASLAQRIRPEITPDGTRTATESKSFAPKANDLVSRLKASTPVPGERGSDGVVRERPEDEQRRNVASANRYAALKGLSTPAQPPQPGQPSRLNTAARMGSLTSLLQADKAAMEKDGGREGSQNTFKSASRGMTR